MSEALLRLRRRANAATSAMALFVLLTNAAAAEPLGLPPVPVPADNAQTPEKAALGEKLFNDKRFSIDGTVSCANCHDPLKGFTDNPLKTSEGHHKLTGTRNAPTVINAAYMKTMFWDGRSASLEDQSQFPMINPIEMGLPNHEPVLKIVREDPAYVDGFKKAFGKSGKDVTMEEVKKAIGAFERTVVAGDSPFDKWYFGGDKTAMNESAKRGYEVFIGQGRCVSCHVIEQTTALFTDNKFHNIGVGINKIQADVPKLAPAYLKAKAAGQDVDKAVISDAKTSELGRFAVTTHFDEMGAFKTPTVRNVTATAPYMHDGSLKTLAEVVDHYNDGGKSAGDPGVNDYLSGGIRPLNLSDQQKQDLVAFMEALTSPRYAAKK